MNAKNTRIDKKTERNRLVYSNLLLLNLAVFFLSWG